MPQIFYSPLERALDSNGDPLPGAKLSFYKAGTSTRKDTYTDEALTTPHANPVVADADGEFAAIYLLGKYKVVLTDADDVQQWSKDNYEAITGGSDVSVDNIKALVDIAATNLGGGETAFVRAFYSDTDTGGGHFYWDADRDKSTANGGTIIDPDTVGTLSATALGTFLTQQGSGVGTGCWVRLTDYVVPEMFGAAGDGSTDDLNPLQAAIDAVEKVHLSPNTAYGVTSTIRPKTGSIILGAGWTSSIQYTDGGAPHSSAVLISVADGNADNVILKDFKVNWNRSGNSGITPGSAHGLLVRGSTNVSLINLHITSAKGDGLNISRQVISSGTNEVPTNNLLVMNCLIEDNERSDCSVTGLLNGRFIGNTFESGAAASAGDGINFELGSASATNNHYIVVSGNSFSNTDRNGVKVDAGATGRIVISGNTFDSVGRDGIVCTSDGELVIDGNLFFSPAQHGINLSGSNSAPPRMVTNNFIISPNNIGITSGAAHTQIVGNYISGSVTAHGIQVSGSTADAVLVASNVCRDNNTDGIRLTDTPTNVSLLNNIIRDNGNDGILAFNGSGHIIMGNDVRSGGSVDNIDLGTATSLTVRDNTGFTTEADGTATVADGTTSISVTHGMDRTPDAADISVTPTNNLGNASKFWISSVGATTFDINVDADPGASTATFAWKGRTL